VFGTGDGLSHFATLDNATLPHEIGAKALLFLMVGPYLYKTHGIGMSAIVTKPRRLVAHATPIARYL
jgi:hypothetical protein